MLLGLQLSLKDRVVYDWERFLIDIDSILFEGVTIDLRKRSALRLEAREQMLQRSTIILEDIVVESNYQLGQLLERNRQLAEEYSIFLEEMQLGGVFFQNQKILARISIPLRGDRGILSFLPLPWQSQKYRLLEDSERPGEAYQEKTLLGEYKRSLTATSYSGLVIDMRGLDFQYSLAPRVFDESGYLIYGPEYLHRRMGIPRGVAGFATNLEASIVKRRAGDDYLYVSGLTATGRYNSDVVLLQSDVEKLFEHPETITNLEKTRVVILIDS